MKHVPHSQQTVIQEHTQILLDASKVAWHQDRIAAWERGERFAPITVDMALTRACNAACTFCYAVLQNQRERHPITVPVMERFLNDCAGMGVRGVSLVSDGESTLSPAYEFSIVRGYELGISMASGTNGILVTKDVAERILPALTYIRININAASEEANCRIMGIRPEWHRQMVRNIRDMVAIKERDRLPVTIGMQQVLMPQYAQETIPLAKLAVELGVDYLVVKHCSDDEDGSLGVDYAAYADLGPMLKEVEALSTPRTQLSVKWNKIGVGNRRSYQRCYGPPFILQISGSGLVAPCGMLFNDRYRKFHIGNIVLESFRDIVYSDRYWEVMSYLGSDKFDARRMCGALCLQDLTNRILDKHRKGEVNLSNGLLIEIPEHANFI